MTGYQAFLIGVLILWPLVIVGVLFLMSRLEEYVKRRNGDSPLPAAADPGPQQADDREVKIVFGDQVVGEDR